MTNVILAGFQRNGASMLSFAYNELDNVSSLAEIFATNTGNLEEIKRFDTRWRMYALRKLFGMNRFPFVVEPTVKFFPPMASDESCKKFFELVVSGEMRSDTSYHMNIDDTVTFMVVHFDHCPSWYQTWDTILDYTDTKVIYVRRDNPLKLAISSANANNQQQWQVIEEEPRIGQVQIQPRNLADYFVFYDIQTQYFDWRFDNHPNTLIVEYNDLVTKWDELVPQISEWLGLEETNIPQVTQQQIQGNQHLSLVSNLAELLRYFKGSPWEHYFDEQFA